MILLTLFERTALGSDGSAIFSDRVWVVLGDTLGLTETQLQIIRAVFDESTEYAMAANLGVSIDKIRSELSHIHRKLGTQDRVELALLVMAEFIRLFGDPEADPPSVTPAPGIRCFNRRRRPRPAAPGLPLRGAGRPPSRT